MNKPEPLYKNKNSQSVLLEEGTASAVKKLRKAFVRPDLYCMRIT